MQAFLQATAEIRAAPRPLPSSDSMKVISQKGVSLRTLAWNLSLKLTGEAGLRFLPLHTQTPRLPRPRSSWSSKPRGPRGKPRGFRSPSARGACGAARPTAGTHLGCSLYTEPSTPTVMRITSSLRLSRMRLMTPASPAAHMCAARVDTLSQARRTMSQSVAEGRSPSVLRML